MDFFACVEALRVPVNMSGQFLSSWIDPVLSVTGQSVPKSTCTLVNSYLFMVNSYLSQLVPKSTRI